MFNTTYLINTNWNGNIITLRSEHLNQQAYQFGVKIELYVDSPPGWADYYDTQEDFTELVEEATPQFSVVPMNSVYQNASGDMLYILQQGNATSSIKRPLLIVDGDDPINSKSRYYYWKDHLHKISELSTLNLDLSQFDIYLLTFNDCRTDARTNAMATLQATQFVHSLYGNTEVEGTILAGFSMGGILSRYALAFAEQNNIPHYCHQYVAIDSPQRGAMVSWNFIDSINELNDDVNSFGGDIRLQLLVLSSNSTSAKQLIRTNANSESNYNGMGNTNADCTDFFSEMNQEDRIQYIQNWDNTAQVSELLNYYNGSSLGQKPGFPYKQNNIQSIAISNGMLEQSGNVNNVPNLVVINTVIPEIFYSSNRTVPSLPYDCQPGSTFGLEPEEDRMFNYDIPIAATRSSLYLKNASKSGLSPTDSQFDISNFTSINTVMKPVDWTLEKYIEDHSNFDKVIYKSMLGMPLTGPSGGPKWYWRHEVDDQTVADNNVFGKALKWSSEFENRAIFTISGIVDEPNCSDITVKAYVNGILLPTKMEDEFVHANGSFFVPYTILKDANIKIVFEKAGFLPTIKYVLFHYNATNASTTSIDNLQVHLCPYNNIRVSSRSGGYETITEAIGAIVESEQTITQPVTINVDLGNIVNGVATPYEENINLSQLPSSIPSLTISGLYPNIVIRGSIIVNAQNPINQLIFHRLTIEGRLLSNYEGLSFSRHIAHVTLDNCTVRNFENGIALSSSVPITLTACKFYNNGLIEDSNYGAICISSTSAIIDNCLIHDNSGIFGGAIHAVASTISILNCTFDNNRSSGTGEISSGTPGGAVYLKNCRDIKIKNNLFTNNHTSGSSGPLDITMTDDDYINSPVNLSINNNTFINNSPMPIGYLNHHGTVGPCFTGCNFSFSNSYIADHAFSNNIITFLGGDHDFMLAANQCSGQLNINNCDFIMDTISSSYYGAIMQKYSNLTTKFNNCLFQTGANNTVFSRPEMPSLTATNTVMYSLFNHGYSGVDTAFQVSTNVSNMLLDSEFHPIWDEDVKSPCIDAGDPDPFPLLHSEYLPWDEDSDHSRFDIGALTPWNTGHRNGLITLEKSEEWNWVSIPAIDYPNSSRNADNITNVFNNFRENDLFDSDPNARQLSELQWLYNTEAGGVQWDVLHNPPIFAFSNPNHQVRSQYGYKIQLRQDAGPETKQIEFDGFQPGNTGNSITSLELMPPVAGTAGCTVNPETGVLEREVWLGYFLDKSMNPFVALTSVLPHIVAIKSQEWCMERELVLNANNMLTYSDTWIGPMSAGHEGGFVINPGEMVAVRYIGNSDMQFHWGGENPEPPISPFFKREKAEHFVYNKKIDYLPIFAYIDLSSYEEGKEPQEISIYVDGVCKGAEKIKGEEIQLKAYILDDPVLEGKTVEFKYWSPIKSGSQANPTFQVLDNHTGTYTAQFASLNHSGNYIKIKLDNPDSDNPQLPTVTALMGNYPNPFNPDTIIRFSLVNESKVSLDVFNIKGQKVRTLVNETKTTGFYSSKWDGRDDKGNQVSSGVYFYRLNADKNSLTKKMILMK